MLVCKEHMERTAEKHIREIYSEQELDQMDSIEEAAPWLDPGPDRQSLKFCLKAAS